MTNQDDGCDPRQAARDELAPDGKTLALMLENVIIEGEQQICYIQGMLKVKADFPKGRAGGESAVHCRGFCSGSPASQSEDSTGQRVTDVRYCRGEYDVSLADGSGRKFKEYDLAFKIDSSSNGPNPVKPALVPTGRVGDRAVVVFADIAELRGALKTHCRD